MENNVEEKRLTITVRVNPAKWKEATKKFLDLQGYRKGWQGDFVDAAISEWLKTQLKKK